MRVVSDTSPIIFLSKINALNLLGDCFGEVFIPPAVEKELGTRPPAGTQTAAVSAEGRQYVRGSTGRLHAGELEAIVLAQELKADYVVLDDLFARRKAQRLGVKPIGTILLSQRRDLLSLRDAEEKTFC